MTARFPLQPVLDLAREGVDAATVRLGDAMQRLMDADRKLKTLLEYREEYQARLHDSVTSGIDSARWRNFHLFLAKLEAGIDAARSQADAARAVANRTQAEWQELQRKLKAYGVLAQRHGREQASIEARREQRASDDQASNTFRRNLPTQRLR